VHGSSLVATVRNILVLVGSFRRESLNQRLARALERLASSRLRFDYFEIVSLPHYDNDLWADPPETVLDLRRRAAAANGLLIVTPEYNRSIPGALKNALDWGSRPEGQSVWDRKPVAICGATPGRLGTASAQSHLRSILPALGMYLTSRHEVYLTLKEGVISDDYEIASERIKIFLVAFLEDFAGWIEVTSGSTSRGGPPR